MKVILTKVVYYKGLSPLHIEIDASLMVAIYIQQ